MSAPTRSDATVARTIAAMARPPFAVGDSFCLSQPGFNAIDCTPMRAPLAMADYLAPHVRGRNFVEIGSMRGDLVACLAAISNATSIEENTDYCENLRRRGVNVVCERLNSANALRVLPPADVYYVWIDPDTNIALARLIDATLRARGVRGKVFFPMDQEGMDDSMGKIGGQLAEIRGMHYGCSGKVERVFFDEERLVRNRREPCPDMPRLVDYSHPFALRHGHFGIFHVLSFEAGLPVEKRHQSCQRHRHWSERESER